MNNMATRTPLSARIPGWRLALLTWPLAGMAAGAATTAAATEPFSWAQFLGPFHHLVLHYPIGFISLALLLELIYWRRPGPELRRFNSLVIVLGGIGAVVSASLGLMRAAEGGYDAAALNLHRGFGLAVGGLSVVASVLAFAVMRHPGSSGWLWGYRGVLGVCTAALIVTGHEGGNLSHGANYLTKNAPPMIKNLMGEAPASATVAATDLKPGEQLYAEKVRPVLEKQCYQCHGTEKQKGGLRLDQMASALKGGDSEKPSIKPGDPMASELVRLILLPRDHDDAMPPSGKGQLTSDQILDIIHWIQAGAPVPEAAR
jgi:mono/diheme cytochrome c family protein/uncharacterized membrane protein